MTISFWSLCSQQQKQQQHQPAAYSRRKDRQWWRKWRCSIWWSRDDETTSQLFRRAASRWAARSRSADERYRCCPKKRKWQSSARLWGFRRRCCRWRRRCYYRPPEDDREWRKNGNESCLLSGGRRLPWFDPRAADSGIIQRIGLLIVNSEENINVRIVSGYLTEATENLIQNLWALSIDLAITLGIIQYQTIYHLKIYWKYLKSWLCAGWSVLWFGLSIELKCGGYNFTTLDLNLYQRTLHLFFHYSSLNYL